MQNGQCLFALKHVVWLNGGLHDRLIYAIYVHTQFSNRTTQTYTIIYLTLHAEPHLHTEPQMQTTITYHTYSFKHTQFPFKAINVILRFAGSALQIKAHFHVSHTTIRTDTHKHTRTRTIRTTSTVTTSKDDDNTSTAMRSEGFGRAFRFRCDSLSRLLCRLILRADMAMSM